MQIATAISGTYEINLPSWGRSFWQDPTDGKLFLAYASGLNEVDYVYSADSGVSWSQPQLMFAIDSFDSHNNFDILMDPRGHIHAGFRLNGSGCYQFFGKIPGGTWTASSGLGVRPLHNATTSGAGFQGSLTLLDNFYFANSFTGTDSSIWVPQITIASIKADPGDGRGCFPEMFALPHPYNTPVTLVTALTHGVPPNQGYPIIEAENGGVHDFRTMFLAVSGTSLLGAFDVNPFGYFSADITSATLGRIWSNGYAMAFGSGCGEKTGQMVLTSGPNGAQIFGNLEGGFDTAYTAISNSYGTLGSGSMENSEWLNGFRLNVPFSSVSGTNVDFSFTEVKNRNIYYFQGKDENGTTCIQRICSDWRRGLNISDPNASSSHVFTSLSHSVSGIKNIAKCDKNNSGGISSVAYWKNFKACKHPIGPGIRPNPNHYKGEFLVTQSFTPTAVSGNILSIFDIDRVESVKPNIKSMPSFLFDYTKDFNATVIASGGITGGNILDRNPNTITTLNPGAFVTIGFDRPLHINKIEFGKNYTPNWGIMTVSGSFDNVTYRKINDGTLSQTPNMQYVYVTSDDRDVSTVGNLGRIGYLNSPVCQYLRLQWASGLAVNLSDFRIYGKGGVRRLRVALPPNGTAALSGNFVFHDEPRLTEKSRHTEKFYYQADGTNPPGFDTYGGALWRVKGSGNFARSNFLPGYNLTTEERGIVPSGRFAGETHGASGDFFAIQSTPTSNVGDSGVLRTVIRVNRFETRRISFNRRWDLHSNDTFEFFTAYPGQGSGIRQFSVIGGTSNNYEPFSINLTGGSYDGIDYELKWIYRRGTVTQPNVMGSVWIDDLVGLSGPTPSIYAYMFGAAGQGTGIINAYIQGYDYSSINAYLLGSALTSSVNAYLYIGRPEETSSVNAYMLGKGIWTNAYLLGASGDILTTYPTGTVYAYLNAASGDPINIVTSVDNPYTIHAYMNAYGIPSVSGNIYSYLSAQKPNISVNAWLGSNSGLVGTSEVTALMVGFDGSQKINAFLLASTGIYYSSTNSYIQGWNLGPDYFTAPQSMVYAWTPSSIDSGNMQTHAFMKASQPYSSVHGYMGPGSGAGAIASGPGGFGQSTSGVVIGQNLIHSYLKGVSDSQKINAYLLNNGAVGQVFAYMPAGAETNTVHSYLIGHQVASGFIYSYISGVPFTSTSVNAYVNAISGSVSEEVYAFISGHEEVISNIMAVTLGIPGSGECNAHGFPLAPENPGTIPNCYPGMLL